MISKEKVCRHFDESMPAMMKRDSVESYKLGIEHCYDYIKENEEKK